MNKRFQLGISLVEIMVALTIGLFLTAGIIQLFHSSKQTYRAQEGFSRLQENGRYALDVMARSLRGHGNLGCFSMAGLVGEEPLELDSNCTVVNTHWTRLNVLAKDLRNGSDALVGLEAPIGYHEDTTTGTTRNLVLPASSGVTWVDDTDALVVAGVYGSGTYLGSDMPYDDYDAGLVLTNNDQGFKIKDLLLVTNCENVDIFQVSGVTVTGGVTSIEHGKTVTDGSGNACDRLSTQYRAEDTDAINSMVFPFDFTSYFIGTKNSGATRELYVYSRGGQTRELVRNVDDMSLRFFGHDDDNTNGPDGYQSADDVTDWAEVRTVEIRLLVSSPEQTLSQQRTYQAPWGGRQYTDRHQREIFATTVSLRPRTDWMAK